MKRSNNSPRVQGTTSTAFNEGPQQKLEESFPVRPSSSWVELRQMAIEAIRRKLEKGDVRAATWALEHREELANRAERPLCLNPHHACLAHFDMRLIHDLVTEEPTAEEFSHEVLPNLAEVRENKVQRTTSTTFNEGPQQKLEGRFPVRPSSSWVELRQKAIEVIRRKLEKGDLRAAIWVLRYVKELANSADRPLCLNPNHAFLDHLNTSWVLMKATIVTTAKAFGRELPPDLAEVRDRWDRLRGDEGESDGSSRKGLTKL